MFRCRRVVLFGLKKHGAGVASARISPPLNLSPLPYVLFVFFGSRNSIFDKSMTLPPRLTHLCLPSFDVLGGGEEIVTDSGLHLIDINHN